MDASCSPGELRPCFTLAIALSPIRLKLRCDPLVTSVAVSGSTHFRWAFMRGAVRIERRSVHRGVALAARPGGVAAAVAEASDVTDEDLVRAERADQGLS